MCLRPRVVRAFKEKRGEEGTGVVVSVSPDASATAPLILHHVCIWEGNRRGCHKRSLAWSQWDASLQFANKWRSGPSPKELEFQGAGRQLAVMRRPQPVWPGSRHIPRWLAILHGT
jgi:hypothetical protein